MNPQQILAVGAGHNRAEYQYLHDGAPHSSTAFGIKEKVEISINIPRSLGGLSVNLEIYNEAVNRILLDEYGCHILRTPILFL